MNGVVGLGGGIAQQVSQGSPKDVIFSDRANNACYHNDRNFVDDLHFMAT